MFAMANREGYINAPTCFWSSVDVLTENHRGGPNTTTKVADGGAAAMNIEAEGPILLSTTEVNRTFVFQELRQTIERLLEVEAIR